MLVPEFPDSREIVIDDKQLFDEIFNANPPELSAYTFTNLFAWRFPYNSLVSRFGEMLIVCQEHKDHALCLEPIGPGGVKETIENVLNTRESGIECVERVHYHIAKLFKDDPRYVVEPERDNFDYLYSADELINLPGRKFDGKRNFVSGLKSEFEYEYLSMDKEIAERCQEFADEWCEEKSCETQEGLRRERCAVYEMLSNFDALGLRGGAIAFEGKIAAFALGEKLNPETLVVHVEKATADRRGLYQLINNDFCKHEAASLKYVNREQDLGVPGLRTAKKSYHPVRMVEAYRIRLQVTGGSVTGGLG